jgi:xylulokinase
MEGVAANSAWLFGYVEKFAGERLTPVRLVGGGAQSTLWCQIFADTLGREVHQVREPMTAQLRGMALMASVALGRRRFEELDSVHIPVQVFTPNTQFADLYRQKVAMLPRLYQRDKKWARRSRTK